MIHCIKNATTGEFVKQLEEMLRDDVKCLHDIFDIFNDNYIKFDTDCLDYSSNGASIISFYSIPIFLLGATAHNVEIYINWFFNSGRTIVKIEEMSEDEFGIVEKYHEYEFNF